MREKIRDFMEGHLGCTNKEICWGTGFTPHQVSIAVLAIRKEWTDKLKPSTSDSEAVERAMSIIQARGLGR
jgi:hypothetical protein